MENSINQAAHAINQGPPLEERSEAPRCRASQPSIQFLVTYDERDGGGGIFARYLSKTELKT